MAGEKTGGRGRMNKVIRQCNDCNYCCDSDDFIYLGDGVFSCPMCSCKRTHIKEIVEKE